MEAATSKRRRGKREKAPPPPAAAAAAASYKQQQPRAKRKSRMLQKHGNDSNRGGVEALLPSLIGLAVLACGVMAKMGFRGRASVAGIDLGTTNSVICVQQQDKGVGTIECIADPATGSPIVPSTVSFLEPWERKVGPSSKVPSQLNPHPTHVIVGSAAKRRIDSHPHHTLYQAKRVLGRVMDDPAVKELQGEVEFGVHGANDGVYFSVPDTPIAITPEQVGSYVVSHLLQITKTFLGHDNVKAAVICVPAKFNDEQRQKTYDAFRAAGVSVARVVEEPTAAALAYGLQHKEGVNYILVYDFGGGTLDVSMLHVSAGFVDVMGSDGDDRLGGADFDAAVARWLLQSRGGQEVVDKVNDALQQLQVEQQDKDLEQMLSAQCKDMFAQTPLCTLSSFHTLGEQLKIQLSQEDKPQSVSCLSLTSLPEPTIESFCSSLSPCTFSMTMAEYDEAVAVLLGRASLPVSRLMADLDLTTHDIDEVVLVGGTTRMPQVRALVKEALPGSQVNTHIDPDLTVAYGAASVID